MKIQVLIKTFLSMKKSLLLVFLLLLSSAIVFAQDTIVEKPERIQKEKKQKKPIGENLYFGGNLGLTFGSYTRVALYPLVGYKITPKFSGGVKVLYEYIKDNRYASSYEYSNYGGSLFTRYRLFSQLYLHAEYAMINYQLWNFNGEQYRDWVPFLYLGGGYSQQIGGGAWLNMQILFDVLQDSRSPYQQWAPFYSIGIGVGF